MGIETIISAIVAAIIAIFAAFKLGGIKAKSKADTDSRINTNNIETARVLESNTKAAEAQVKAANNSSEVQNEVSKLNDGDAINELRRDFTRN